MMIKVDGNILKYKIIVKQQKNITVNVHEVNILFYHFLIR
jgi:hypothetical protein